MEDDPLTDLERTLFAVRLREKTIGFWRDFSMLFIFVIAFLFGAGVIGGVQFMLCKAKAGDITMLECFSGQRLSAKKF